MKGFYGYLLEFSKKYKIFPIIFPNKKVFYKTDYKDVLRFVNRFENLDNEVSIFANKEPSNLVEILNIDRKKVLLLPIPWYLLFLIIKFVELLPIKSNFRSDSLLSIWGS